MDLSILEIEQELRETKNELGQVRERFNARSKQYHDALLDYKKSYAISYLKAKHDGMTNGEAEMEAQKENAGKEARYKALEQLEISERKAVDALIEKAAILRSLYARARKEMEEYHKREDF